MNPVRERFQDIQDAIAQIEKHSELDRQAFDESELIQVWMIHHFQIIGEAVRAVDPAFRNQHPEVPWADIIGMRNILVHDYGRVNLEIVWEAVRQHVPKLKVEIQTILTALPSDE